MPDAGWPHVDFYSLTDGMALGGTYFGGGGFLLKNSPSDMEMEALQTIPYDLGYRSLENGDEIVIQELRGASGSLAPGERFFVRGTYTLASTNEARLFLSVLATSGQTPERKNNWDNLVIKKGQGMFTLSTVMPEAGFPRLRYLSSDGKEFGEVSFGKGESLLTMSAGEYQRKMEAQFADPSNGCASSQVISNIPYELGSRSLENGDEILIQEVRGGDGSFVPGERFFVSGTYKLASRDEAILRLSVENTLGQTPQPDGRNNAIVKKGGGSFDFSIIMPDAGYPRISLISLDRRKAFGCVYFGKGETLSRTPLNISN